MFRFTCRTIPLSPLSTSLIWTLPSLYCVTSFTANVNRNCILEKSHVPLFRLFLSHPFWCLQTCTVPIPRIVRQVTPTSLSTTTPPSTLVDLLKWSGNIRPPEDEGDSSIFIKAMRYRDTKETIKPIGGSSHPLSPKILRRARRDQKRDSAKILIWHITHE